MILGNEQARVVNNLERVVCIDLPTYPEPARGTLTVVETGHSVPFPIARIFYIYGLKNDCERGAHAHREAEQVFIAVSGSFSLTLTNAHQTKTYTMNEPSRGVYVPPMIWARLHNFSDDAVCVVLTSSLYDPADYIRNWDEFVLAVGKSSQ